MPTPFFIHPSLWLVQSAIGKLPSTSAKLVRDAFARVYSRQFIFGEYKRGAWSEVSTTQGLIEVAIIDLLPPGRNASVLSSADRAKKILRKLLYFVISAFIFVSVLIR